MSEQAEKASIEELRQTIEHLKLQLEEKKLNQALGGWDDTVKQKRSLKDIKKGLANGELKYNPK